MNEEDVRRHVRAIRDQIEGDAEEHPDLERELFPYADGSLRSEAIEAHLRTCARCAEDVRDVRDLRSVRRRSRVAYLAVAAAVTAIVIAALFLMRKSSTVPAAGPPRSHPVDIRAPVPVPDEWEPLLRAARAGKMPSMPPVLRALARNHETLRGETAGAGSLAPAGVVVETQQPLFKWSAAANDRSVVSIFAGEDEVARSATIRGGRWTPRDPLRRGVTYSWEVRVENGDAVRIIPAPPAPPLFFRVLDADAHAELERARKMRGGDPLLLALLYARAGLVDAALEQTAHVKDADRNVAKRLHEVLTSWHR
jgi:hypothetical protein